jgi:hypothetical protein
MTPLRFANPSPSSGWIEDFHLQAVVHTRHTRNKAASAGGPFARIILLIGQNFLVDFELLNQSLDFFHANWFLPAAPPPVETLTVVGTVVSRAICTIISPPISVVWSAISISIVCGGIAAVVAGRIATVVAIAGSVVAIARTISVGA